MEQADLNEHMVLLEGKAARLKHDFVDHDREGLCDWVLKHEGFAARQARFINKLQSGYRSDWIPARLLGNQAERKRWLLYHFYRHLPLFFRAYAYFFYRYFFRLGFLDGLQGFIFHFLQGCWYPFYTDVKIYEQRLRKNQTAGALKT